MTLLRSWIFFSALLLITSLVAHLSTFFTDPLQTIPYIFVLHVAIFPPFIAAIIYAKKLEPSNLNQEAVLKFAPRWMQLATGAFFAYALVNFAIFFHPHAWRQPGNA